MWSENTFVRRSHGEEDVKVEIWNQAQTVEQSIFNLDWNGEYKQNLRWGLNWQLSSDFCETEIKCEKSQKLLTPLLPSGGSLWMRLSGSNLLLRQVRDEEQLKKIREEDESGM